MQPALWAACARWVPQGVRAVHKCCVCVNLPMWIARKKVEDART